MKRTVDRLIAGLVCATLIGSPALADSAQTSVNRDSVTLDSSASASSPGQDRIQHDAQSADPETEAALAALQAIYPDVSREQAIATFAFEERYSLFATDLEQRYQGNYAGAWIDHQIGGVLVIAMTDPSVAKESVADDLGARVQFVKVDRSLEELLILADDLNQHIDSNVGEASPDIKSNGIWIELLGSAMAEAKRDEELAAAVNSVESQGIRVTYRELDGMPIEDSCSSTTNCNPLPAGAAISGPGPCSSGFKVKRSNGDLGMLTAKHCPTGTYSHYIYNVLTSTGGLEHSTADVRFLKTTGALSIADDVYSFGSLKDMSGHANPVLDQTVCRGGRNSSDCGVVVHIAISGSRFRINNMASCGGDSGGPVYRNSTAYGTHQSSTATSCPGPSNETSYAVKVSAALIGMVLIFQTS